MVTIDLGTPTAPEIWDAWDGVPRRVGLTLPELRLLAERAGAPLPFDITAPITAPPTSANGLASRLGPSTRATQDGAYAAALAALGDPAESLAQRGLLIAGAVDPGIAGALGLLAAPRTALDLDVAVGGLRAHAWHRQRGDAVAALATADGLVLELSWFSAAAWPAELARVAALPEDTALRPSSVPTLLRVPLETVDAAAEAVRSGRPELVPIVAGDPALGVVLTALAGEARGRLRALVTAVGADPRPIGVASWTLLADGWHAVRPRRGGSGDAQIEIALVEPDSLAAELAPLLAEVA
jgi:hypothetical protein